MKTSNISPASKTVIGAITLLLSVSLSTVQLAQAQTFAGENQLREDPTVLPALIYPAKNPQTIRVNAHNRYGGPLTIVIRDGKGNIRHTKTTFMPKYIGRFDLSPLDAGMYTFELSNEIGQTYTRTFRIETPTSRVIAMGDSLENSLEPGGKYGSIDH